MRFISFLFALISIFILFVGCGGYEKRIHIRSVYQASTWNPSRDRFAFARGYRIFKAPIGLSRFPDGGTSKALHESISFYIVDIKSGKIQMIDHFSNARKCNSRHLWNVTINWEGNIITYSLVNRVWDRVQKVHRKWSVGPFSFDVINSKKISLPEEDKNAKTKIDKTDIRPGKKKKGNMRLSGREIRNYTRNAKVEGWGIDPLDYCKLSNEEYIEDLMTLKGDREYRYAIIERLGKELKRDEIKKILEEFKEKMDKLKSSDSLKHMSHRYSIEEMDKRLRSILQGPEKSSVAE